MRKEHVNIARYLPEFLSKDKVFKAVNQSDSNEHERLRLKIKDLINNLYVESATWAVPIWERLFLIEDVADNLSDRRAEILIRMNTNVISTRQFMESLANRYIVDKSAEIIENVSDYSFTLNCTKGKCFNFPAVEKAIEIYKPAHLGWEITETQKINSKVKVFGKLLFTNSMELELGKKYEVKPLNTLKIKVFGKIIQNNEEVI